MLIYPLGGILIVGAVMCGINPIMGMINTAMTKLAERHGRYLKGPAGCDRGRYDEHRHGRPLQQGGLRLSAPQPSPPATMRSWPLSWWAAWCLPSPSPSPPPSAPGSGLPDERRNGIVNYIMGLCFVTEGAILIAAADPLRVLPSCVIGAALSGALSMTFGCALRAPHGGIFVFPVVTTL